MSWLDEYLKEERERDREDLRQLEEELRCENDPRRIRKLEKDIKKIRKIIHQRELHVREIYNSSFPSSWKIIYFTKYIINFLRGIKLKYILMFLLLLLICLFFLLMQFLSNINFCTNNQFDFAVINDITKYLSCGEKTLFSSGNILIDKKLGINAYYDKNYPEAVKRFTDVRQKGQNDPETLIYLNNAKAEIASRENSEIEVYVITAIIPVNNLEVASDILRGVAQLQEEFNQDKKNFNNTNKVLKILIANDANNEERAIEIAKFLVKMPHILAVVGHYSSDATLAASITYEKNKIVYISPGSTSTEFSTGSRKDYFYRTVPSLDQYTSALGNFIKQKNYTKLVVFYNHRSKYADNFLLNFIRDLKGSRIEIIINKDQKDFILSDPFFQADIAIQKFKNQKNTAFVLIPDGGTSEYSLPNAIKLIKANRKEHDIFGANTLFSVDTLLIGNDAVDSLLIPISQSESILPNSSLAFVTKAKELWKIREINERTVLSYDAAKALIIALPNVPRSDSSKPIREKLQDRLSQIHIVGANNEAFKFEKGERKPIFGEIKVELAKIIAFKCSTYGYIFVPEKYDNQKLENNCQ